MNEEVQRTIGKQEGQIEGLKQQVNVVDRRLDKIEERLEHIDRTLNQAKGGWRTLMLVAGMSAAIGAFLSKLAVIFGFSLPR